MRLALAANAGRIDKAQPAALKLDQFIDGITRGARYGRNDGPWVPVSMLSRVDLPTLGRPMMAIDISCCSNSP